MTSASLPTILWDLDGTLTDPQVGIVTCIRHSLTRFGLTPPPHEELLWCIGPPLDETFRALVPGSTEADAWKMIEFYRERFSTVGLFENEVYAEIPHLLVELSRTHRLMLATSKPHVFASRILDHFDLTRFFAQVYGSELSGERSNKAELIRYILDTEGLSTDATTMIGDRKHDMIGAKRNSVRAVGVTWGYGSRDELVTAGADIVCDNVGELRQLLYSGRAGRLS